MASMLVGDATNEKSKIYVLDTNIVLHDVQCLYSFEEHTIVLPLKVIEDLSKFQSGNGELANNARTALKKLDDMRAYGSLMKGVRLGNGGRLLITSFQRLSTAGHAGSHNDLHLDTAVIEEVKSRLREVHAEDSEVLLLTLWLSISEQREVILVTKDLPTRLKADSVSMTVEDYRRQLVDAKFSGFRKVWIPASQWDDIVGPSTRSDVRRRLELESVGEEESPDCDSEDEKKENMANGVELEEMSAEEKADLMGMLRELPVESLAKVVKMVKAAMGDASQFDADFDIVTVTTKQLRATERAIRQLRGEVDPSSPTAKNGDTSGKSESDQAEDVVSVSFDLLPRLNKLLELRDDEEALLPNEFVMLYKCDDSVTQDVAVGDTSDPTSPQGRARSRSSQVLGSKLTERDGHGGDFSPPKNGKSCGPQRADLILYHTQRRNHADKDKEAEMEYGADRSVTRDRGGFRLRPLSLPSRVCWNIEPRSDGQRMALELLCDPNVHLVTIGGAAGCGKTLLAMAAALHLTFCEGLFERILVSRPITPLGSDLGALPGAVDEKLLPWMRPIYDALEHLVPPKRDDSDPYASGNQTTSKHSNNRFSALMDNDSQSGGSLDVRGYSTTSTPSVHGQETSHSGGKSKRARRRSAVVANRIHEASTQSALQHSKICHSAVTSITHEQALAKVQLEAITYIRGRSITRSIVLIDEAQNLTPHETKCIVSRAGQGTKVILMGDTAQVDKPFLDALSCGLSFTAERMKVSHVSGHVTLQTSERSTLAAVAARLL